MECTFEMRIYVLSKVFWGALEGFIKTHGHLIEEFRYDQMAEWVNLYEALLYSRGSPLDSCVGIIDRKKV